MIQKIALLDSELLAELATVHPSPCLSLYQPTHRHPPENRQDLIRFRNLVKDLKKSLRQKYPLVETRLLLKPFKALARNQDFWNHTLDGLAVLVDEFSIARSRELGSDDLAEVGQAAAAGIDETGWHLPLLN
jgi:hypothetical protein